MSERAEVEVIVPVDRVPSREEHKQLVHAAFEAAAGLVRPHGGQVLGIMSMSRAVSLTGDLAMKARFAVLVPESVTERPKVITIPSKPGDKA